MVKNAVSGVNTAKWFSYTYSWKLFVGGKDAVGPKTTL